MNDPSSPMANPGRCLYEQTRRLQKAKRQLLRRGVTAVPVRDATVLQFPTNKEAPDGQD